MQDINKIVETHNKNGCSTISKKGVNLLGAKKYSVSIYPNDTKLIDCKFINIQDVAGYVKDKADILSQKNNHVGTWYNEDDGLTYIDIVVILSNKKEAIKLAKINKQISIYDLKNNLEINTL